jgi:DNA mismatch repair protein MutL
MGIIRVLDDHIANQIAAGEVVERPSSVVKELVENAIDAGSTRIDVTVEEGGLSLIRIADNGSGIAPDDLERAFSRHATSKISSGKDLFRIRTLGFRGEALPSIAAVSKVECATSDGDEGLGKRIVLEGGKVAVLEDSAASKGTDIRVKELFYNTPARLKYMKTIQTELSHISDYMYRLAMSHPGIAFMLKHNGNTLLQTLGNGDLLSVIAAIYGTGLAKMMLPVQGENPDYQLTGYISRPEQTRSNRYGISAVINGRYIRNYALAQSLLKAYHTLLPINRFPVAVLHITMDPALLDVNVHPSKLEVRFSKETELLEFLERTVRNTLSRESHIPQAAKPAGSKPAVIQEQLPLYRPGKSVLLSGDDLEPLEEEEQPTRRLSGEDAGTSEGTVNDPLWTQGETDSREPGSSAWSVKDGGNWPVSGGSFNNRPSDPQAPPSAAPWSVRDQAGGYSSAPPSRSASSGPSQQPQILPPDTVRKVLEALEPVKEETARLPRLPELDPIGQLHGTYIVAQNPDGMYLIDQHAAHERIHYEYYYELFGKPHEASQELLVPITLEFTPTEAELLKTRLSYLEQVGVYIEAFGGNTFLVRAYPHWFPPGEEKDIIDEMTDWVLSEKKSIDLSKLREKSSTLCSCKASIKANHSLTKVEMEALLDRLSECRIPYTCPHGRPIVVSFSKYELEKMFKRVM